MPHWFRAILLVAVLSAAYQNSAFARPDTAIEPPPPPPPPPPNAVSSLINPGSLIESGTGAFLQGLISGFFAPPPPPPFAAADVPAAPPSAGGAVGGWNFDPLAIFLGLPESSNRKLPVVPRDRDYTPSSSSSSGSNNGTGTAGTGPGTVSRLAADAPILPPPEVIEQVLKECNRTIHPITVQPPTTPDIPPERATASIIWDYFKKLKVPKFKALDV